MFPILAFYRSPNTLLWCKKNCRKSSSKSADIYSLYITTLITVLTEGETGETENKSTGLMYEKPAHVKRSTPINVLLNNKYSQFRIQVYIIVHSLHRILCNWKMPIFIPKVWCRFNYRGVNSGVSCAIFPLFEI